MPAGQPSPIPVAPSFSSASLAAALGAELQGPGDIALTGLNTLELAGPNDLTFIRSPRYAAAWSSSRAGACLLTRGLDLPPGGGRRAILLVPDADLALIQAIRLFKPADPRPAAGIHPSAIVDPSAAIDPSASVGIMCIIGAGCVIGAGCILHPRVTLGPGVRLGTETELESGVIIHDRCVIGASCLIHSGAVIGADGFGFRPSPDGHGVIKIPHVGNVEIHEYVEIGACTCIDRGKFGATIIGAGTKIDNLVQIAHNVRIGRGCLIAGCTGIGGSVVMHDGVMVGGHAGIADNLKLGAGARVSAFAAVMRDIPPGEAVLGVPAEPARQFMRKMAWLRRQMGHKGRAGWAGADTPAD
jgi:UDP-3-O-[3-hydroxymyristoyl] glucosamine N-acyltransferase